MPGNGEIIERAINDFQKIQEHMENAKSENAVKTYEHLKKDYFHRNSFFVNSKFSSPLPLIFKEPFLCSKISKNSIALATVKAMGRLVKLIRFLTFFCFIIRDELQGSRHLQYHTAKLI